MGKRRVIAETGAGSHGTAVAAAASLAGMECIIYMGEEDTRRQALNVFRMRMMGAKVVAVTAGQRTLKEAVDAAIGDWIANLDDTFYLLGSAVGPHPYPTVVRHFQSVISREARAQMLADEKALPDYCIACVGGGSNAIGMFAAFLDDVAVKLIGVEAAGRGLDSLGDHAATMSKGTPGVLHGFRSYLLQDGKGEAAPVHSISAGLDYPGVGPEHAMLKDMGRVHYESATDKEAVDAFLALSRSEGIIPALESAHALACAMRIAPTLGRDKRILVCLSGRGDKDVQTVADLADAGRISI
jgi:tryptophan synthase beta chain